MLGPKGPVWALLLALSLPVGYGMKSYFQNNKQKNWVSLFGVINVLFTGGFALFQLEGIWFAIKEASFPLIIGIGVYISAFTKSPLIKILIFNAPILDLQKIQNHLYPNVSSRQETSTEYENINLNTIKESTTSHSYEKLFNHFSLHKLFKKSTVYFSLSFLLSSFLNLVLALKIFKPITSDLSEMDKMVILNEQVAQMTWLSFLVIALPLTFFTGFIFWNLMKGLEKITGLDIQEMLKIHTESKS